MKIKTKFNLGIIFVFGLLATGISFITVQWVNNNTIKEAENRVEVYIKAAWEIHEGKTARIRSALEILAQEQTTRDLLRDPENLALLRIVRENLEVIRREQDMDILTLMDSQGRVILRTRFPYKEGDIVLDDSMVKKVILTKTASGGNIILSEDRLEIEGEGLADQCMKFGGEPRGMLMGAAVPIIVDGKLMGILQMGNLLNGATEKVDRIRDAVFENRQYGGKPVGTATIFMRDLRISTNVLDNQGRRAVGTRVSKEVAEHVWKKDLPWTGRAWVIDAWYLSRYDPIKDPDGTIIGMLYVGELEQRYLDMRSQAVMLILSVIFAGMMLAFLVFIWITRNIVKPIEELSYATKKLSEGNLSYRVGLRTSDEVGTLSVAFNHMAEQLEKQHREIQHHQKSLERVNEELKAINRNYMEMLGFVSHELKNPLASAIMSLHTVKNGYLGELNNPQKRELEAVARSLDYFNDMINNYLDLSRLEKGELEVKKRSITLHSELVINVLERLERELNERKVVVENRIPNDMGLNADGDLLRIVYENLLSNAIKYGRQGGRIVLDAHEGENETIMSVYNDGEGVPKEKMPMLFKKFSRIDAPKYAGKKGTGLGLFICKEIIDKHGGTIWAESEEGKWAKISFTLPKLEKENRQ